MASHQRTNYVNSIYKLTSLLILSIALSTSAFGQQFGIKASGGISRIYGQLDIQHDPELPITTSFSPSFQAGIYWRFPMGRITSVGAELLYSKVQGAQTLRWRESYFNGTVSHTNYEDVSFMSFPIYVGFTFNKLTFNAGFQVSLALSSTAKSKSLFLHDGKEEELANSSSSHFPVRDFDFGPRAGIIYQMNNRLSLEGIFYYGLGDISIAQLENTDLKIQQMTVGLRYALKDKQDGHLTSFANQQFGVKFSGGLSQISNSLNMPTLSTQYAPSGQGGVYYNQTLGNGSSLGMELLFSQIEGKETWEGYELLMNSDNKMRMVYLKNNFHRHISYISLPVYYGININKLTIHAGAQISYAITTSSRSESTGTWNEQPYHEETKSVHMDVDKFDFGPRVGMIYPLNNKLSVEATYYYGFNNIQKNGSPADELKVQQASLGVKYNLWTKQTSK